jgi:hypothetical protein
MTTKPPHYYFIRSIVRFTFWSGVGLLSILGIGQLADIVDPDNDNPCRIVLNRNFTWVVGKLYAQIE